MYTYFTRADGVTHLLYDPKQQLKLRLELETAGPVSVGTREELGPVLSGKGILLTTGLEQEFVLGLGDRIFIIAETTDRVKLIVEPIPYVPEILELMQKEAGISTTASPAPPAKPGVVQRGPAKRPPLAQRPKLGRKKW
jgi:hypothetical protein